MQSVCDMFRIGIGPSSSHTVGPMRAAGMFVAALQEKGAMTSVTRITADIHGALALTGRGHQTDRAIVLGLAGFAPDSVEIAFIPQFIDKVKTSGRLPLAQGPLVEFPQESSLVFHEEALPFHENGLVLSAFAHESLLLAKTYYSVGGGFVVDAEDIAAQPAGAVAQPFPYRSAAELLRHCREAGLPLAEVVLRNECAMRTQAEVEDHFAAVWRTMQTCLAHGMVTEGMLDGPLAVPRRAAPLYQMLMRGGANHDPMRIVDWVNMFALAVSEENAAGGRVVTAPTNGACGIIPAVLAYYDRFVSPLNPDQVLRFFLASGAIGSLYKMNASISGAEVGCQGEVGVACSMAAAGLAELMGGTPEQICVAAEIGMEHNLGLTCDPVAGQVQVPCIERNAIAAVKAINCARMAMQRDSAPCISLDTVIETMYETGRDMNTKYRETSSGGLAAKVGCGFCGSSSPCS